MRSSAGMHRQGSPRARNRSVAAQSKARWSCWPTRITHADTELLCRTPTQLAPDDKYVVILDEDDATVTVWNVLHVKRKWP